MSVEQANIPVQSGSPRGFGFVMSAVFALVALYPLMVGGGLRWWALIPALVFLMLAVARPATLSRPNQLWFRFGLFLGAIVAPIVMGVVFFLVVLPMGLLRRLRVRDPLGMSPDASQPSYWIKRDQAPQSMRNQF